MPGLVLNESGNQNTTERNKNCNHSIFQIPTKTYSLFRCKNTVEFFQPLFYFLQDSDPLFNFFFLYLQVIFHFSGYDVIFQFTEY